MRFDRPICLAASAVIATTASLWGIETSVGRFQRTSAGLRSISAAGAERLEACASRTSAYQADPRFSFHEI
jgi:hypothetical protein